MNSQRVSRSQPTRAGSASLRRRIASITTRLRRALLRRRRPLAALLLGVAAGAALLTLAPPGPPTVAVTVVAHDLPAGTRLASADLARVDLPPDDVPGHVLDAPVGEVLAAPMRRGEPLTDARVVGPGLTADSGQVAVPVRLSDADQAALLGPGDRIDLYATDPADGETATRTLARDVVVLAVPPQESGGGAIGGRLVIVGADASGVMATTAASVASFVTFAWVSR